MVFLQLSFFNFSFEISLYKTAAVKMLAHLQMKKENYLLKMFQSEHPKPIVKLLAVKTVSGLGERSHKSTVLFVQVLVPVGDQTSTFWGWFLKQGREYFKQSRNILLNSASVIEVGTSSL